MDINEIEITNKELIGTYGTGYLTKNVYKITLNNGKTYLSEQILKKGGNGNAVVIIGLADKSVILVRELRPNIGTLVTEFPAGMIENNEEPVKTAKRELEEETGYTSDDISLVEWHYQDQGCSKAKIYTFLARNCYKNCEQKLDDDEVLKPLIVPVEKLDVMFLEDVFKDANSKIAYFTLKRNLSLK